MLILVIKSNVLKSICVKEANTKRDWIKQTFLNKSKFKHRCGIGSLLVSKFMTSKDRNIGSCSFSLPLRLLVGSEPLAGLIKSK